MKNHKNRRKFSKTCLKLNFQTVENLPCLKYRLKIGATPRAVEVTTIYEKKFDFWAFDPIYVEMETTGLV